MKKTINFEDFVQEFKEHGNGKENKFSLEGLKAIFEHIEFLEQTNDYEQDLDVLEICSSFKEYKNIEEFQNEWGEQYTSIDKIKEWFAEVIEIENENFIVGVE